jgi:ABC-2 type transport system ATP-binding protein
MPVVCDDLTHVYVTETALRNFFLEVEQGKIYGILGHNGCGKSTSLNIIAGVAKPTYGKVFIFGRNPK